MIESSIHIKLDKFDGPLGLLLHLVQREEMDIRQLDITRITDQYLEYLQKLQDINFDIAGEYLFLAATLLYIKSKDSVNLEQAEEKHQSDEDFEITTKAQLIAKLEELQRFQSLSQRFWNESYRLGEHIFVKPKIDKKSIQNSILTPMDLGELTKVMVDWIRRESRKYTVVKRDRLSIREKLKRLKQMLTPGPMTSLDKLVEDAESREDLVITFISLLELARLKRLEVFQNEAFGEIYVNVIKDLKDFDIESADGFEDEESTTSGSTQEQATVS